MRSPRVAFRGFVCYGECCMQTMFHIISFLNPRKILERRARKQLERKVDAGTTRAIKEFRQTFEKLKAYDRT